MCVAPEEVSRSLGWLILTRDVVMNAPPLLILTCLPFKILGVVALCFISSLGCPETLPQVNVSPDMRPSALCMFTSSKLLCWMNADRSYLALFFDADRRDSLKVKGAKIKHK